MKSKGRVFYRPDVGLWGVRLTWNKKQEKLHYIPADTQVPCETEGLASILLKIINDDIAAETFNPLRYKKNGSFTVEAIFKLWLKVRKKQAVRKEIAWGSYSISKNAFDKIIPLIGTEMVHTVKKVTYEDLWDDLENIKKNTRKNYLSHFFQMMDWAEEHGYIVKAPKRLEFKKKFAVDDADKIYYLSLQKQLKVLQQVQLKHRPIFLFLILTGIRTGEARALRKTDLFPDEQIIIIRNTFKRGQTGQILGEVKQRVERKILYPKEIQNFINSLPENGSEFVFINPETGKHYGENYRRIWNLAVKKALGEEEHCKLKNGTRHTYGNRLHNKGVDIKLVSAIMGHSNIKTTKTFYVEEDTITPSKKAHKKVVSINNQILLNAASG